MTLDLKLQGVSLPDGMTSEMLVQAAARGVSNALQRHFRARNASAKHREGMPRSNYWAHVADAVQTIAKGDKATVLVDHEGVMLHWKGGTVRPVKAKALAIPLAPEVADTNPREYSRGHTLLALVKRLVGKRKRKAPLLVDKATGRALWVLLKSAKLDPDASVVPPEESLVQAGRAAIP